MEDKLYYGIEGQRYGPVSMDEIRRLATEGQLRPSDYIWETRTQTWMRAESVPGLFTPPVATPPDAGPPDATPPESEEPSAEAHAPEPARFESPRDSLSGAEGLLSSAPTGDDRFATPGWGAEAAAPPYEHAPVEYADFFMRLGAHIIDGLVLLVPNFLWGMFAIFAAMLSTLSLEEIENLDPDTIDAEFFGNGFIALFYLGVFIISWLYFAGLEASAWQGSVGKKAMGIRVVDADGQRIGFGRASIRALSKIFLSGIFFVGYLIMFVTERKQCLHDLLAGTYCEKL